MSPCWRMSSRNAVRSVGMSTCARVGGGRPEPCYHPAGARGMSRNAAGKKERAGTPCPPFHTTRKRLRDQRLQRRMLAHEGEVFRPAVEPEHVAGLLGDQVGEHAGI